MSFTELPLEIKYKILEKCPQLRFVFPEFRTLLIDFRKPPELDYPYEKNKHRKSIIIEYISNSNGVQDKLQLEFRNKNMECVEIINDISRVQCVAFHKTLPLMITGCDNGFIKIYELNHDFIINECISCIQSHHDIILSIAFHNLAFHNLAFHNLAFHNSAFHNSAFHNSVFHNSALIIASSSVDFTIKLWSFNYKKRHIEHIITLTEHKSYLKKVLFHPSLSILASASHDNKVKLWNVDISNPKNTVCVSTLQAHTYSANTLDFHLTRALLATAGYDHEIKIWLLNHNSTDASLLLNLEGHRHIVKAVKFHEIAPYLVSGGYDSSIKLWLFNDNYTSASCVASLDSNSPVYTISVHKSGLIACGTHDGYIIVWELDERKKNAIYRITNKHENHISCLEFHKNTENIVLVSCGDKFIKLWK
jgi:WD40 repeat protein